MKATIVQPPPVESTVVVEMTLWEAQELERLLVGRYWGGVGSRLYAALKGTH